MKKKNSGPQNTIQSLPAREAILVNNKCASLGGTASAWSRASLGRTKFGRTLRGFVPLLLLLPHGPPLKVLWTSGVVPPEGKRDSRVFSFFPFLSYPILSFLFLFFFFSFPPISPLFFVVYYKNSDQG